MTTQVDELEELEFTGSRTDYLKQNPGMWLFIGTKNYRGGMGDYRKAGFEHAVRVNDGKWDHYIRWPLEADEES